MLKATLESTLYAVGRGEIWMPSVAGTLALEGALRVAGWPTTSFVSLSPVAIGFIVFSLFLLYWLGLSVMAAALSALRGGPASIADNWVEPALAARAAFVTAIAAVPVLIGSLVILPGLYLGVIWSQITMIVLDGRAKRASDAHLVMTQHGGLFDAFELSSMLTQGARFDILTMLVGLGFLFGGVELFESMLTTMTAGRSFAWLAAATQLATKALFDTFSLCFMAALYFELDTRAFVDSERETPDLALPVESSGPDVRS